MTDTLDGKLVVLVGGSGFLGTHIAQNLLQRGARVRIAARREERALKLKPLANLGQIQFVPCDATRPEHLKAALHGADAAIWLVGAFRGPLGAMQRDGAAHAAQIAHDMAMESFVYVSAIGADPASEVEYARTKDEGEQAVLAAFAQATIIRPSVLFGEEAGLIPLLSRLIAGNCLVPVLAPEAKIQPLFVDDAAKAAVAALVSPQQHGGRTYEIGGARAITMAELNRMIASAQGRERKFIELSDRMAGLLVGLTGWLPGAPINRDQWQLLKAGSTVSGAFHGLRDLGVTPRPLELFLERWMVAYRKRGRFSPPARA